ncbi:ferrous iron transport protein A [Candidatus Latescibacterota bacterium]
MEQKHKLTEKKLTEMAPGEYGIITTVNTEGELKRRLMDMGIIEGAQVEVVKQAPLGDPLQIKVHNTLIALRKKEASTILIESLGMSIHGRFRRRYRAGR